MVGIFLSPFIMHRLGDTAFGIWVLIFSITGYYGIFDLGIALRSSATSPSTPPPRKWTSWHNTSIPASRAYGAIGLLSMVVTVFLSFYVDRFFRIPSGMHSQARILLLLVGGSVSLGFPLGISIGILEGLQRYYLNNWIAVVMSWSRAALIVFFLYRGYGLITIALITVLPTVAAAMVRAFLCNTPAFPFPTG